MCAIAPGSPIQLLCALVLCVAYLLLVLHAKPYKGELEDRLAFLTSLCLSVSLLLGLTLIMDKPVDPVFDVTLLGLILIVINVLPFFFIIYAMVEILRKGAMVGVRTKLLLENDAAAGGANQLTTKVHPITGRRREARQLSKQMSLQQMRTVVTKDKVVKLQDNHANSHKAILTKIRKREQQADARVRQRLIERRQLKSRSEVAATAKSIISGKNKDDSEKLPIPNDVRACKLSNLPKSAQEEGSTSIISEESLVVVEKVRATLKKKVQTLQRLRGVFTQLDVDANGMLSKKEFEKLVSAILKKKSLDQKMLRLLWDAAWEQRKHGAEDELDSATLGHWLGLDG